MSYQICHISNHLLSKVDGRKIVVGCEFHVVHVLIEEALAQISV
jgi:hypothetical protein